MTDVVGRTSREDVLGRIRQALGPDRTTPAEVTRDYRLVDGRPPGDSALLEMLVDRVEDYRASVLPASASVLAAVAELDPSVPRIHFGTGTSELLGAMAEAGADVVGVDFRLPLDEAARRLPPGVAVQGNLDPALLFAPGDVLDARVTATVEAGRAAAGHVFNLGHGVPPTADPAVLQRVVDRVRVS